MKRLRDHEDLLRQNNISFQDSAGENESLNAESGYDSTDEHPDMIGPDLSTPSTTVGSGRSYEARYALFNWLFQGSSLSQEQSAFHEPRSTTYARLNANSTDNF